MEENELFNSGKNFSDNQANNPYSSVPNTSETKHVNYNTNYNTNYNKGNSKRNGCLIAVVIVLALFLISTSMFFSFLGSMFSGIASSEIDSHYYEEDYVEVINIEGTIGAESTNSYGAALGYRHDYTLDLVDTLMTDAYNKGIVLNINSGGGGLYESDELYLKLKEYKEITGNPIYAYYAQTAASGAVYISMVADEIYANRTTMTGSIGVKITNYNVTELMNKLGIKETSIVSGKNKNMFSSTSPVTEEQIAIMQNLVDESYNLFVDIIIEERGLEKNKVLEFADGRLYTPTQAMEYGMIDGIASYDEFQAYLETIPEFENCYFYEEEYTYSNIFDFLFSNAPEKPLSEVDLLTNLLKRSQGNIIEY